MRPLTMVCVTGLVLLCAVTSVTAQSTGDHGDPLIKELQPTNTPTYEGRVEGETIETPFVIDSIPITVWGDTCPFLNDYDEACPFYGSMSPDVVYSYYCNHSRTVTIDLCASEYDTKVYVYENEYTPVTPVESVSWSTLKALHR